MHILQSRTFQGINFDSVFADAEFWGVNFDPFCAIFEYLLCSRSLRGIKFYAFFAYVGHPGEWL